MVDLRLSQLECDIDRKLDGMPEMKRTQAVLFINYFLDLFAVTKERTDRESKLSQEAMEAENEELEAKRSRG